MFWQITKKDLLISLRDKSAWFILLLMPIVLILIFTAVFGSNEDFSFFPVNVVVANLDEVGTNPANLNLSEQFVSFLQSEKMQEMLTISTITSREEAIQLIRDGKVQVGIVIPPDFTPSFFGETRTDVEILGDAGSTVVPGIVRSIVDSYITILEANRIQFSSLAHVFGQYQSDAQAGQMQTKEWMSQAAIQELPIHFTDTVEKGKMKLTVSTYYAAAMAVMFLLFTGNLGIFSILEERENRTMLRLKTTSLDKISLIAGKFLMVVILGLIQISVLIIFTSVVTKANWGNSFAGLAYLTLAGISSIASLSILVAAITKSSKAADAINWVAIQILAFFGGSFIPIDNLPPIVQTISKFTVNGQALKGYLILMQGGSFSDVFGTGLILFTTTIVFLALGTYFLQFGEEVI